MHLSNLSPVRVLGASLGLVLALGATAAQAHDVIVCKKSDSTSPVAAGTSFSFTFDGAPFSLTVGGACMQFSNVGVGNHAITEAANPGTAVSAITVSPSDRLVSSDPANGTVTVEATDDPTPATVTFVNAANAAAGFVCPPADLAGRPLMAHSNSASQLFCRFQTIPNDFFCKYFLDTGLLKQDHDNGNCPPVANLQD
jgi:hypothetical protein